MKLIEEIGPIIVEPKLAAELGVPEIIMPEDSIVTERRICRKCGYGFYWPPIGGEEVRDKDLCSRCDRLGGGKAGDPCDDDFDPCDVDFMREIST